MSNERKYLEIGGVYFFMEELSYLEDKELIRLLKKNSKSFNSIQTISIANLLEIVDDGDILNDFLNLILKATDKPRWKIWTPLRRSHVILEKVSKDGRYNFEGIKNSEIEKVLTAFFFLNQSLMKKLKEYANNLTKILEMRNLEVQAGSLKNGLEKTKIKKTSKTSTEN